jgi:hypothetical protein
MASRLQTVKSVDKDDPRRAKPRGPQSFSRAATGIVLSLSLAAGLFIWFKLRVVTGMPRSAYADPDQQVVEPPPRQRATEPSEPQKAVPQRWAPDLETSPEHGENQNQNRENPGESPVEVLQPAR